VQPVNINDTQPARYQYGHSDHPQLLHQHYAWDEDRKENCTFSSLSRRQVVEAGGRMQDAGGGSLRHLQFCGMKIGRRIAPVI
jgi:hypothetical protein